ncbi:MAG TPA: prepilin-type N-terminal cleavage/methylation domain-containing protein [Nitrospirae bacterium]|nr:hypothetical protein BMS3Abin06_02543 [bacterium BMS3Abin06]HDH11559.1 prepilin-type N-terminal cleavage/methylation domain-containing protein [Nitrospirota bacterium]HDL20844.1 prepilin-type N-terminal cleavage/methylation domain-containing protein [Nitrospirota bacterium]HDZ00607.1 prepilin-type N-terminal cleavage/methylation domain-containing protein [Nitrospirota bacterium]
MDGDKLRTINNEQRTMNKYGFTLVEVMVAMVILLLGMLGVMGMQYYAITGNAGSREVRTATSLSQEIVEQLKGTPYADLANGTDTPTAGTAISGGISFTKRWWVFANCAALNLTSDDSTCGASLTAACSVVPDGTAAVRSTAIRARTCWSDKNGVTHSVTIDSLRWDENAIP